MLLLVVAITIVLALVAIIAVALLQRKRLRKWVRLELRNQGNVQSRYELKAEDPSSALEFTFMLNGDSLPMGGTPEAARAMEAMAASSKAGPAGGAQAAAALDAGQPQTEAGQPGTEQAQEMAGQAQATTQEAQEMAGQAQDAAKQAQEGAEKVTGLSKSVADALDSLGMMLPRSVGAPLLDASFRIRGVHGRVDQAQKMPGRVSGQVKKVQAPVATAAGSVKPPEALAAQAAEVSGTVAVPPVEMPDATATSTAAAPSPVVVSKPADGLDVPVVEPAAAAVGAAEGWVRTPYVQPGKTMSLDLGLKPIRTRKSKRYSFEVLSRGVEQSDAPVINEDWSSEISGASGWPRYHPYALILALSAFFILLALWLDSLGVIS